MVKSNSKMITYYTFKYASDTLKVVKIDNFYTIIINRKRIISVENLEEIQKIYLYILNQLILNVWNYNLKYCIEQCEKNLIINLHRNKPKYEI